MDEVQEIPNEGEVIVIATVKCVAHADAVELNEQVPRAGVLYCSIVVARDVAGRVMLL